MRYLLCALAMTLTGCAANAPAPPNPNSVPNILLDITEARAQTGVIFVSGSLSDGTSAGQSARFVVTPDDKLICTFKRRSAQGDATMTAHRFNIAGLYGAVSTAVLPNEATTNVAYQASFQVELQTASGPEWTQTGIGDPRFDRLMQVFATYPTPCWAFG